MGQGVWLSEISQTEKDKSCMLSLICGIEKIKLVNITKKKETQIKRTNERLPEGRGKGGGARWGRLLKGTYYDEQNK